MRIRDAVPADTDAIRRVHERSIEELGRPAYSPAQVAAWAAGCESAAYGDAIEAEDVAFVVAEDDDELVGFGSLRLGTPLEYDRTVDAEITAVYVHPEVARQGVGTHLHAELERRARAVGVDTLGLTASLNAVPFYESLGYERVREYAHEFSGDLSTDVTGTVVEMTKPLAGTELSEPPRRSG